jgi:hypothetical protein
MKTRRRSVTSLTTSGGPRDDSSPGAEPVPWRNCCQRWPPPFRPITAPTRRHAFPYTCEEELQYVLWNAFFHPISPSTKFDSDKPDINTEIKFQMKLLRLMCIRFSFSVGSEGWACLGSVTYSISLYTITKTAYISIHVYFW